MTVLPAHLPRACPRCRGRLLHAADAYGAYSSCVACGFVRDWLSAPAIDPSRVDRSRHRRGEPKHGGRAL